MVVKPEFDEALRFSEGLAAVKIGNTFGYISKDGKVVIPPQFNWADEFTDGIAMIEIGKNIIKNKVVYINREGRYVWEPSI